MPLCIVVTRDVEMRYRGFLGSVMLELSPGLYIGPNLSKGVRERVWSVVSDWHASLQTGSVVMAWRDRSAPGGIRVQSLGEPPKDLVKHEGSLLVRRALRGSC
ncbi:CRISPR-associated protein, Cas2 family [Filomicrobium insigne]|uniref:CRISPR-associated protein, Cas2 family n=1 Tax=Filomicrobium insigne TaxID=418854 RepID=A0A1H0HMZ5_9HYPH|nr:type I-E CRISPR-associated endoribonuclease Cas2e [Filomicrobium insigne]SDO20424.1 CRISPR-associated protein, Cas2 family [Filomicrobium insigne]